ncbi:nucleoside 2-deoxyribosyltransferase [Spirosoma pulveris]
MNANGLVYLCGPITGTLNGTASTWRNDVKSLLAPNINCIDPMRYKPDLIRQADSAYSIESELRRLNHGKEVLSRDRMDVSRCDVVLANFNGSEKVSIGSVGEIFWADAFRKPVIVVRELAGNEHDHDMINSIASFICRDIFEATAYIKTLFAY